MSRVLTVRVYDSSGKDLLQATELVDLRLESTFRDVLSDLPDDFADLTLLKVFVREHEGAPDLSSPSRSDCVLAFWRRALQRST
jgi:hypothetical protein